MRLFKLDKQYTKNLELITTPYGNLARRYNISFITGKDSIYKYCYKYNFKTTKEQKDFLINKLTKPSYHANYEYREAVWGLVFNNNPFIIYYSEKGLSIQVEPNIEEKEFKKLLCSIRDYLNE